MPKPPQADRTWAKDAACRQYEADAWFPEIGGSPREVLNICHGQCPVRRECLEYAMATEYASYRYGVWGGLTPAQRKDLHAQRLRAAEAEQEAA